jgi:predicted dienelactone hydrolase
MDLQKVLTLPRAEFETAISDLSGSPLDLFAYGDRIEQIGKLIKDRHQEAAVAEAEALSMMHGNTFTNGMDKVSIRRSKKWSFDDKERSLIESKLTPLEKDVKALKSSLKAREEYLVKVGEATLESESVTISLAKK